MRGAAIKVRMPKIAVATAAREELGWPATALRPLIQERQRQSQEHEVQRSNSRHELLTSPASLSGGEGCEPPSVDS